MNFRDTIKIVIRFLDSHLNHLGVTEIIQRVMSLFLLPISSGQRQSFFKNDEGSQSQDKDIYELKKNLKIYIATTRWSVVLCLNSIRQISRSWLPFYNIVLQKPHPLWFYVYLFKCLCFFDSYYVYLWSESKQIF